MKKAEAALERVFFAGVLGVASRWASHSSQVWSKRCWTSWRPDTLAGVLGQDAGLGSQGWDTPTG